MTTPLESQASSVAADEEAGRYFRYMAEFVGFTEDDAKAIRQSALVVEKHLPDIIGCFYTNLLQYPPTRKIFLKMDGSVDEDYLQLRMLHQANFWRRTAGGMYDDDYARFVDYVGRAHTSRGADPHIYIAERYVIGMIGFVQHAIVDALIKELNGYDDDLEMRAIKAWNKLCMVLLEMLARAYGEERVSESLGELIPVNPGAIYQMSVDSYEKGLGIHRPLEYTDVRVAGVDEIPDGERKIVEHKGVSIGVFHHNGGWYALRNSCLHRGGPVATGKLVGDNIVCPWHGYTYNLTDGKLLMDPSARLEIYTVSVKDGAVYLGFPELAQEPEAPSVSETEAVAEPALKENEYLVSQVKPGEVKLAFLNGRKIAVYNIEGAFYATQEECTHASGPLSEGDLDGKVITCPWHDSCFDVTDGSVVCGPAEQPLKTFSVTMHGEIGRVEIKE
jgi:nitrite reductase/ring-hydroxylating ferredoxin subunit/hemoglobin-like flavoprotein